jgi:hypothetical protein
METFLTPPTIAKRLGTNPDRVLHWIRTGELKAFNTSITQRRARWKVSPSDLQQFLDRRSNQVHVKPERKLRRVPVVVKRYV